MEQSWRYTSYADASPDAHWSRDGRKYVVMSNRAIVGTIVHNDGPVGREYWMWNISAAGDNGPPTGFAETKEDAMRGFAAAWRQWLADAALVEVEPPK
jgi:hypothetical protein